MSKKRKSRKRTAAKRKTSTKRRRGGSVVGFFIRVIIFAFAIYGAYQLAPNDDPHFKASNTATFKYNK